MSFTDLFNPSFLMYLGIMVLVISILVVYFESKIREQNHKIASMFSIVSTLAEDNNQMKFVIGNMAQNFTGGSNITLEEDIKNFITKQSPQLISVSDDEDSENEEEEEEEEDDDSEDDDKEIRANEINDFDSESESDSDSDSDSNSNIEEFDISKVKVLKISNEAILEKDDKNINFFAHEDLSEQDLINSNLDEEPLELMEEEILEISEQNNTIQTISKDEFKKINIDLEESTNQSESLDYKKLSLKELKNIVAEKGLVSDTSKLKKPELFKLLGVE